MGSFLRLQPGRPDRAAHGYVYYRWTSRYVALVRWALKRRGLGPVRTAVGKHLAETHHAKVVPAETARRVITVDRPVELHDLERVVPYRVARDVVLEASPTIALATCACRATARQSGRSAHCGPLEQCLYIGEPIATFVAEKQPTARLITAEEALGVIDAAAERGAIHTMWFKDAAAGRMYAICNCCSCCCIGLAAYREGFHPLAGSGYCAVVDADACSACRACIPTCAFDALSMTGVRGTAYVDEQLCFGCGACVRQCPTSAIELEPAAVGAPAPFTLEEGSPGSVRG